jgi:hypothetical protein
MHKRKRENRDYCYQARKKALASKRSNPKSVEKTREIPPQLPPIELTTRPYQIAQELSITGLPAELREMVMLYFKSFGLKIWSLNQVWESEWNKVALIKNTTTNTTTTTTNQKTKEEKKRLYYDFCGNEIFDSNWMHYELPCRQWKISFPAPKQPIHLGMTIQSAEKTESSSLQSRYERNVTPQNQVWSACLLDQHRIAICTTSSEVEIISLDPPFNSLAYTQTPKIVYVDDAKYPQAAEAKQESLQDSFLRQCTEEEQKRRGSTDIWALEVARTCRVCFSAKHQLLNVVTRQGCVFVYTVLPKLQLKYTLLDASLNPAVWSNSSAGVLYTHATMVNDEVVCVTSPLGYTYSYDILRGVCLTMWQDSIHGHHHPPQPFLSVEDRAYKLNQAEFPRDLIALGDGCHVLMTWSEKLSIWNAITGKFVREWQDVSSVSSKLRVSTSLDNDEAFLVHHSDGSAFKKRF